MRYLKWLSMLTILAMLFAMLPATVAEDGVAVEEGEIVDGEPEIEVEGVEGLDALDDPALVLEDADLELDGLEEELQTYETEGQTEAAAAANASGDFVIDEEGTLTKYNGFDKNLVIPDGVKAIGSGVFEGYDIETVVIPEGVTSIGSSAFEECDKLKSVSLPDSLTSIGIGAFNGCTGLTSISIPKNVTSLGGWVFSGCSDLTSVQLSGKIEALTSVEFSNTGLKNLDFLKGTGIKEISGSAFSGCDNLQSITIPDSVATIGSSAFFHCTNLESVTIPAGVTTIDRSAFNNSDNVTIRGTAGTYAERFANAMGIPFNAPVVTIDEKTSWIYDDSDSYDALILYINQSRTLNAIQKPADLARTLKWSSSNTGVVTVDQSGNIKGISKGTATITAATADGKGKAAQIKVYVPEPTEINIYSDDDEIILGRTVDIEANVDIPYQYDTKVEMPITWSSSDSSIISIEATDESSATLKGNNPGKATITATTTDGGRASVELEVVRPEAESVKIDQSGPIQLYIGRQYALTATVSPAEAEAKLTWYSDDSSVAVVGSDGVITAVAEGETYINVKTENGYYSDIWVEVLPTPSKVKLNKTKATLGVKEKLTLKVTLTPADAKTTLTWKSNKPTVAAVSKKGVVVAKKEGTAVITVKATNGMTAKATITVRAAPKSVTLNKSGTVTLKRGKTLKLKATLPKKTASALTWRSSKPKIASVDQKGVVRALKKGTAVITVRTFNGKTAKVTIKVK